MQQSKMIHMKFDCNLAVVERPPQFVLTVCLHYANAADMLLTHTCSTQATKPLTNLHHYL